MSQDDYNNYMILRCYQLAVSSPDPSTQNGAIIVNKHGVELGSSCNKFTNGVVPTPQMLERPLKYTYMEHAERGAVYDAAQRGLGKLEGATMFSPWAPCAECARAIVQCGIKTLVRHKDACDRTPASWAESLRTAEAILKLGGVSIEEISGKIGGPEVLHSGVRWEP
jgi:dCMP deaminase